MAATHTGKFLARAEGPPLIVEYFRRAHRAGRLAHAYLFTGAAGSGRRSFAVTLAAGLLCPTGEPCQSCASCRAVAHGNHPGLEIFRSSGRKASMDIAAVRDVSTRDHRRHADLRIWVVEDAERLSAAAANAFLKTLEEPSAGTLLIMIAPSTGSILPTLVSRCQRLQFPDRRQEPRADGDSGPVANEVLAAARERLFWADHDPREWLAAVVPGADSPRDALAVLLGSLTGAAHARWRSLTHDEPAASAALLGLERLLELRRDLDANVNADLVLEFLIRELRGPYLAPRFTAGGDV